MFTFEDLKTLFSNLVFQLVNEVALYNVNDCVYYGYSMVDHIVEMFQLFFLLKIWEGFLQIFYIIHKTPVAINQCLTLYDTYNDAMNIYRWIIFKDWLDTLLSYLMNVGLNGVDIY